MPYNEQKFQVSKSEWKKRKQFENCALVQPSIAKYPLVQDFFLSLKTLFRYLRRSYLVSNLRRVLESKLGGVVVEWWDSFTDGHNVVELNFWAKQMTKSEAKKKEKKKSKKKTKSTSRITKQKEITKTDVKR